MKDRYFYPLLILVIAAILALSVVPGRRSTNLSFKEILEQGYVLSGADLNLLTAAPATKVSFTNTPASGTNRPDEQSVQTSDLIATLSSNMPRKIAQASAGVFGTLGPNYEKAFGGREIEVTVTARAGLENPLDEFRVGYFTVGVGDSGWQTFTLSENFADYSFTFKNKPPKGKPGNDFVGIWPGDEGKNETMDVKSIRIRVLQ